MSIPNPQLEAALIQFAGQPDVMPDHAAQLRTAVTQDAVLLQQYNQLATDGRLTGFALSQASDTNLIGTYDRAGGVVTLPTNALQATGASPSGDLTAALRIQDMSARYAHGNWTDTAGVTQPINQDMVDNLQATLNGSPVLAEQLRQAITPPGPGQDAPARGFDSLPNGAAAGGTYNPTTGTINLPPGVLNQPPAQFQQSAHAVTDLTFVLGHEVQHGLNAADKAAARTTFLGQIAQVAQHGGPNYDYTAAIDGYQQAARRDEARAHIAGWNALLSREQQINPNANLTEMYSLGNRQVNPGTSRVNDFVTIDPNNTQAALPRLGFSFNPDGSLSMTLPNVEQMAQNYFDKPPNATGIGHHGDSDYPNYYGANAVTAVIFNHRHYAVQPDGKMPAFQIDMARLGFDEQLLERNGIAFPPGTPLPNGTATDVRQPYVDIGQTPNAQGHFDYTRTPAGTHNQHQHVPIPNEISNDRGRPDERTPSPESDFAAYLDRMLAAAESGDDKAFRDMTRTLAGQPAGQALRAEAVEEVNRQELQAQRELEQQDVQRQREAPVMQMQR